MDYIGDLVKRKIDILRGYWFFNEFMDADLPNRKVFLEGLMPFLGDLRNRGFNKRELKMLEHLSFLSTYPKEKRSFALQRWLTAELTSEFMSIKLVKNPLDKDLRKFYNEIYKDVFSEDERESLTKLRVWILGEACAKWIPRRLDDWWDSKYYRNFYGEVVHPRSYVLIAKIKGVVVGGAFVNTLTTDKISFMTIDFFLITLQHLSEIEELKEFNSGEYKVKLSIALFERCKHYAVKDAVRFGDKRPLFLLGEANDPVKMYNKGKLNREHDTENPVLRLRLYSIIGFRFLDFPYISPPMGGDLEPLDYQYSIIYPFSLVGSELDTQLYKHALVTYLSMWADVAKQPVKGMIDNLDNLIRQRKMIKLLNFKELGIPQEIINACRQIKWKIKD